MRTVAAVIVGLVAVGCGSSARPPAEIDRGRAAVTAALDNWKANEPATKLKTLADPVDFTEELRGTHALTGYTVVKHDATDPQVIRFTVTLQLKDKKGKASEREAVYAVALKAPVVVSRDPYF
jgi:hypothetical protein